MGDGKHFTLHVRRHDPKLGRLITVEFVAFHVHQHGSGLGRLITVASVAMEVGFKDAYVDIIPVEHAWYFGSRQSWPVYQCGFYQCHDGEDLSVDIDF